MQKLRNEKTMEGKRRKGTAKRRREEIHQREERRAEGRRERDRERVKCRER